MNPTDLPTGRATAEAETAVRFGDCGHPKRRGAGRYPGAGALRRGTGSPQSTTTAPTGRLRREVRGDRWLSMIYGVGRLDRRQGAWARQQ
jgi:hypothetical protein